MNRKGQPLVRFTPWKFIGAMIILVPTVLISWGIWNLIPAEKAPRIVNLRNGNTRYVITSMREAVIGQAVLGSLIVFSIVAVKVIPNEESRASAPRRAPAVVRTFVGGIATIIAVVLVAFVAFILIKAIVWWPYATVRIIEVDEDNVRFKSLLSSWTYPKDGVAEVDLEVTNDVRGNQATTDMALIVRLKDGTEFEPYERGYPVGDPGIQAYQNVIDALTNDLIPPVVDGAN